MAEPSDNKIFFDNLCREQCCIYRYNDLDKAIASNVFAKNIAISVGVDNTVVMQVDFSYFIAPDGNSLLDEDIVNYSVWSSPYRIQNSKVHFDCYITNILITPETDEARSLGGEVFRIPIRKWYDLQCSNFIEPKIKKNTSNERCSRFEIMEIE
jgi:hypothetical protein